MISDFQIERVHSSERSDCGVLEVRNSKTNECQQYRMFDHVLLKIYVSETIAHGLNIRLELVGLPKATNDSRGKPVTAHTTTGNHSVCTPSLNTKLIKDVQDTDAERRQKREVSDQEHVDVSKRKQLIAQLHDCSSVYHRFHKLLRQSNEDEMETN
ncbi:unnamed protein product [Schistosoma margrebowiei]|uniref:Uncharacterized protein n=1 Tax=Schistosoma margrebowiei TaxID=48269 RepID=A0A183LVA5_9TREM|nr:unnamed protein product [Schistosoma margrebowiei]